MFLSDILQTLPKELTQSERNSHFKSLPNPGATLFFDFHLPGKPTWFIKQGVDVLAEASTQHFFFTLPQGNASAPLIPKILDAFRQDWYCVMEKIEAPTVRPCNPLLETDIESVASAVKWLLDRIPFVPESRSQIRKTRRRLVCGTSSSVYKRSNIVNKLARASQTLTMTSVSGLGKNSFRFINTLNGSY